MLEPESNSVTNGDYEDDADDEDSYDEQGYEEQDAEEEAAQQDTNVNNQ